MSYETRDEAAELVLDRLYAWHCGDIVERVELATRVPRVAIVGRARNASTSRARQLLCLELREAGMSYCEIGTLLGRDHTTIMHAVKRAEMRRERVRVEVA